MDPKVYDELAAELINPYVRLERMPHSLERSLRIKLVAYYRAYYYDEYFIQLKFSYIFILIHFTQFWLIK